MAPSPTESSRSEDGSDALAWLDAVGRRPQRPGPYTLDLTRELLERLGRPQDAFRALHVAGTRGKGSTCALLAAALGAAGLPAGLTTSPHLVDVRERIRLGEREASRDELRAWVARVRRAAGELQPSYFETLIAAAFLAFAESGLPLAVVEVGLGGRLDATVLCRPAVTAITRLGLEHRDRLGDTLREIAREKAGILKEGVPAVLAPNDPEAVEAVAARAAEIGAPLRVLDAEAVVAAPPSGLPGAAQAENAAVAWAVLESLGAQLPQWRVSRAQAERGFAAVSWPGRLDLRSAPDGTPVLVDVAHDLESLAALTAHLDGTGLRPATVIFTCLADKDLPALCGLLGGARSLAAATLLVPELGGLLRARPAAEVVTALEAVGLSARPSASVGTALAEALAGGGAVVATGSFAVAGQVLQRLGAEPEAGASPPRS